MRYKLTPGLLLRVSDTGLKVFYVNKRGSGSMRRFKIGPYPVLSLHDAREKARELLRNIELGRFIEKAPHEVEQRMRTLAEIMPQFIELYAKQRTKDWRNSERVLLKFSSLYSRPIDAIILGGILWCGGVLGHLEWPPRETRPHGPSSNQLKYH